MGLSVLETLFKKKNIFPSSLSSSCLFSCLASYLSSCLLFSFIFSCLFPSLLFHLLVSSLFFHLLLSFLVSPLSSSRFFSVSLSLSLSVSVSVWCGVLWCCVVCVVVVGVLLLVVVFVCVCCGTLKKEREKKNCVCGFKNASVCAFKTSPCMPAPRTCVSTCARGASTHGDVLNLHTEGVLHIHTRHGVIVSSAYQNLPKYGYHVIQRFTKETSGSSPFSVRE